jgi:hypothetical protein
MRCSVRMEGAKFSVPLSGVGAAAGGDEVGSNLRQWKEPLSVQSLWWVLQR